MKRIDRLAMLIYVVIVYCWSLSLYPLGRDFAALAHPGKGWPSIIGYVFSWETGRFGASVHYYHLFNLVLLYTCMVLLYRLVNSVLQGPVWFGTLASTLFMANPVHSEAILNLCGVVDLLPCLLALAALVAYVTAQERPGVFRLLIAYATFAVAVLPLAQNIGLVFVLLLHRVIMSPNRKKMYELVPYALVGLASAYIHKGDLISQGFSVDRAIVPLYFIFYPIGFLPETAKLFHDNAIHAWLAALSTIVLVGLICRKAQRSALVFGLLAMVSVRFFQGGKPVDPVHLVGGGQLLLANALFVVALAALFYRIMENANWRATIVSGTTLLCVVFFALEIRDILAWRHASQQVQEFQRRAAELALAHPGEALGVAPDFQYYLGAPMCLSQSTAWDTAFSKVLPTRSLVPMHYEKSNRLRVEIDSWTPQGGTVRVQGETPIRLMPWPYALTAKGATVESTDARLTLTEVTKDGFAVTVSPLTEPLPAALIPAGIQTAASPRKKADR